MNVRAWLTVVLLTALVSLARAEENSAPEAIRYQRIAAPADRVKDWPVGEGKYLPMDSAEFERLSAPAPNGAAAPPPAAIVSARYEAVLTDDHLTGRATAEVRSSGATRASLAMDPCNLAFGQAVWSDRPASDNQALLGLAASGALELAVERPGRLQFDWSLGGQRDSAGVLGFWFELPPAAANEMIVDLPDHFSPAINDGVVLGFQPAAKGMRRWSIVLGGCRQFRLRVLPAGMAKRRPQLALLRESRTYDLTLRGVEVSTQWRLQVHNAPLRQIVVLLDPGLKLISARCGDNDLSWSVAPMSDGQGTRVSLALAEPIRDVERVVRLGAIAPPVFDRPWRLPRLRAEGLFWQEGTLTVLSPEPLLIDRLAPVGCAQTGVGPLSPPRVGESMQFQGFEPEATVEVLLSRRPVVQKPSEDPETAPAAVEGARAADPPDISQNNEQPKVWAWGVHLESWHPGGGLWHYRATYELQNAGCREMRITLPPGVAREDVRDVQIDGHPPAWPIEAGPSRDSLIVPLPVDEKFPRVAIQWSRVAPPLGIVGTLTPMLPRADLPVLAGRWTAWLAPGYSFFRSAGAAVAPSDDSDAPGWTGRRIDLPASGEVVFRWIHAASACLLATIVALTLAAVGWWCFSRRRVAPSPRPGEPLGVAPRVKSASDSTVTMAAPLGLLVALALFATESAGGESPPYRVLTPIDAEKRPVGDKVFVPEALYQTLYRRQSAPAAQGGWLLADAEYRGVLGSETAPGRLTIDALHAQYDLRTFDRAVKVGIPFGAEGGGLLPTGVLLDGRELESHWDHASGALEFEAPEPGRHRLELWLRPRIHVEGDASWFAAAIPRVPAARLQLSLPAELPTVEVPSARGEVRMESHPPRLSAELGPADRLTVRWSEIASAATGPAVDVQQLIWMKIRPGSVVAVVKFMFRVLDGQTRQIRLSVDPRLRLLPLMGDDPPTVQLGPETGQSRLLALQWPRPIADPTTLEATFLLSGATGVGKFHLPLIEVLDARCTRRWMAVSVDPALDHEEQQPAAPLEPVAISDFAASWGALETKPSAAYRLPAEASDWTVSTRPSEPRAVVDQTLTLSYGPKRVDVLLEARIAINSGYLFQYRLSAPPELSVEEVSLREGGVERIGRWSRDAEGNLTIFLNSAASGRQKLVLRGQMPVALGQETAAPRLRIEPGTVRSSAVRVFQRPGVRLSIRGLKLQSAPAEPSDVAWGQCLGTAVGVESDSLCVTVEQE